MKGNTIMLLNKLSNEKDLDAMTAMALEGVPDQKAFWKTYAKAILKSTAQGAIVGFALLGVAAVVAAVVASATDGDIPE